MQPGRARTSCLGVPPLLLARWVGRVAPVCQTHGVLVLSCPSAALRVHVCAASWATWLSFTGVPASCVVLLVRCPGPLGSCSPLCPLGPLLCVCGILGHLAPVQQCARSVCCLCVRCPGPLGSCSPVCPLGALFCLCCVLDHLAPVHRCACLVCCVACAVSWATGLLFTGVPAGCVVLLVRCPGPLGSCSPLCTLGALLWVCGLLGNLAPVHRYASSFCCLCVRCPGPLGSCSPLCPLGVLCCVRVVLGHLAPVYRCARSVCCVACAVSWATWLLFTGVPPWCVVLLVLCPGPLGSCSPVCLLGVLCCLCCVLGHWAFVHRCAHGVRCFACAVSWATWLLFTAVHARCVALGVRTPGQLGSCPPVCQLVLLPVCAVSWATWLLFTALPARRVVLRARCPGPLGSCLPVCPLGVLCCVCGVLGHLAPVHRCAHAVRCFACPVSWATWLLFTGVPARCVALLMQRPWSLGSCSPVCPLGVLSVCAVSWATWLLFSGVPARCVALLVRSPGPLGSSSLVCPLGVLCCLCAVLGHLAPVHRCARVMRFFAFAVSWREKIEEIASSTSCALFWVKWCWLAMWGIGVRPDTEYDLAKKLKNATKNFST